MTWKDNFVVDGTQTRTWGLVGITGGGGLSSGWGDGGTGFEGEFSFHPVNGHIFGQNESD